MLYHHSNVTYAIMHIRSTIWPTRISIKTKNCIAFFEKTNTVVILVKSRVAHGSRSSSSLFLEFSFSPASVTGND